MSDIVERLRSKARESGESLEKYNMSAWARGLCEGMRDAYEEAATEAATAIEARDAEIAMLRRALEEIEGCQSHNPDNLFRIAYDALKVSP